MKSILVDALRQANGEDTEVELDNSARLQKTNIEEASNDSRDAGPQADELELLDSDPAPPADEPLAAEDEAIQPANSPVQDTEAGFDGAIGKAPSVASDPSLAWTGILDPGRSPASRRTGRPQLRAPRPAAFERWAAWTPAACLLAACLAAAAFSGWNRLAGPGGNADLRALSEFQDVTGTAGGNGTDGSVVSRFGFAEAGASGRRASSPTPSAAESRAPAAGAAPAAIQVQQSPPRRAGNTAPVRTTSFSSAAAAYGAYLAGDIGRYDVERILQSMARDGGEAIELDLKLLLQRYPESALLNLALGTALAEASKWPEAKLAFERAEQLSRAAPGGRLP